MKNNHPIPHNHFKKTAIRYRTSFHLPAQKKIRAEKRLEKSKLVYPMPLKKLQPIVRCPTLRYNRKERLGRGFTPEECREAGHDYMKLRQLGVKIDLRRRNHNKEAFDQNVERLKAYLSKVVVYRNRVEARTSEVEQHKRIIMPIEKKKPVIGCVKVSEIDSKIWAADKVRELMDEVKYKREK